MRHNQISRQNKNKKIKYLAIGLAAGVLGIGSAAGVLTSANSNAVNRSASSSTQDTDQITYKGVTYVPKGNLETYLFAGIDSPDKVTEIKEYDGTGQCDVLLVLVRDRSTDTCKFLTIDRNTMTPVKSLADDGSYIDTTECQISLAHAMSLDHETRAENTVDAVSTLLGGHKIDGFATVRIPIIGKTHVHSILHHIFLQSLNMGRTSIVVDVGAIRLGVDHVGFGAESIKNSLGNVPGASVGTVQRHLHAAEGIDTQRDR